MLSAKSFRSCKTIITPILNCKKPLHKQIRCVHSKLVKYTRNDRTVYVASPALASPESSDRKGWAKILCIISNTLNQYFWTPDTMEFSKKDLLPPADVRGMKTLDKSAFKRIVKIPSLVAPAKSIGYLTKYWKKSLLKIPGVKPVAELSEIEAKCKLILLDPNKYGSVSSLSEEDRGELTKMGVDLQTWKLFDLELCYENWTYSDILRAVVPESSDGVGGFSQIGHIVHLNLRQDLAGYKQIIGEILLDKIKQAKTVVNKTNNIDSTYRNFSMEVLAGEPNFITISKEGGFAYEFDFSKVYWNPRLGTEHERIVNLLEAGDVVYDMFAGVGPFAIPAAKKKCVVFANDLNPESYKWLIHNIKLNKIKIDISAHNLDGRAFVREVVKPDLIQRLQAEDSDFFSHIVMNLPAMAIEFLDVFCGLLQEMDQSMIKSLVLPTIHCHCFSSAEDKKLDVKTRVEAVIGETLSEGSNVKLVRNVAPNKDMMCATFKLTQSVLFGEPRKSEDYTSENQGTKDNKNDLENEPSEKRRKTECNETSP